MEETAFLLSNIATCCIALGVHLLIAVVVMVTPMVRSVGLTDLDRLTAPIAGSLVATAIDASYVKEFRHDYFDSLFGNGNLFSGVCSASSRSTISDRLTLPFNGASLSSRHSACSCSVV